MSDNNEQLTVEAPQAVSVAPPAPSPAVPGPDAPATAPGAPGGQRRARTRGIPAAPTALAALNTVAVAGAGVASAAGPAAGIAAAGAMVVGAASLGIKRRRAVSRSKTQRLQRAAAKRSGMAAGPSALGSGSGSGGSGAGPGRPGSVKGGGGSGLLGSGPRAGSGSGSRPPGSGSGSATGSGSKPGLGSGSRSGSGSGLGSGSGSGIRPRSGSGAGSGVGIGSNGVQGPGSSSPRSRRLAGSGSGSDPTSGGDPGRPRLLRSSPSRTSLARKVIGPRPAGPKTPAGGLVRRGDGSLRSVPNKIRHPLGGGLARSTSGSGRGTIGNSKLVRGARRIGNGSRRSAAAVRRAYHSKPGRAARAVSIGTTKRAWGVGIPALAALAVGTRAALGRRGWRAVAQAAKASWGRNRARFAKHSKHGKAAAEVAAAKVASIPGATVNMPTNLVGATPAAPAGGSTGGGNSMAQARFIEAAAEMLGAAMSYRPEGMMQVGNDFNRMPEAFRNIANAMQTMAQRAHDEDPIHNSILDQMQMVYQHLQAAAKAAEDLGPAFRTLHAIDIQRIEQPRRNEQRWDFANNRDHAGGLGGGGGYSRPASSPASNNAPTYEAGSRYINRDTSPGATTS